MFVLKRSTDAVGSYQTHPYAHMVVLAGVSRYICRGYHGRNQGMQRLERLLKMMDEINKGRAPSVERFCEMFECKQRTVYNDIAYLRDFMNMPIEFDRHRGGYISTDPSRKLPQFELNEGELFALTLGKDMLAEYSGTAFEPILRGAIEKIAERLPDKVKMDVADLTPVVRFKAGGIVSLSRKTFIDLTKACEKRTVVELVYFSASDGQSSFRHIEPYQVLESGGAWYVVAWCRLRNAMRMFALHRISEYKLTSETFALRDGVDVTRYLDSAFVLEHREQEQKYVIKFDATAARYVRERKWHASQELTEHDDGSCTLSFTATSMEEIKRWVLTYGASAQVVQPKKLREMLHNEFQRGAGLYGGPTPHAVPARKIAAKTSVGNRSEVSSPSKPRLPKTE